MQGTFGDVGELSRGYATKEIAYHRIMALPARQDHRKQKRKALLEPQMGADVVPDSPVRPAKKIRTDSGADFRTPFAPCLCLERMWSQH